MRILRIAACVLGMSTLAVGCYEQPTAVDDSTSALFKKGEKPGGGDENPYAITDLGTLPGSDGSSANDINEDTVVVGYSKPYGFVWTDAAGMQGLDPLGGGEQSYASGISDEGWIVGHTVFPNDWSSHGTLWTPDGNGGYDALPLEEPTTGPGPGTPGSNALDVNNEGQIVGIAFDGGIGGGGPVIWNAAREIERWLVTLRGGQEAGAWAINDAGQAVGYSEVGVGTDTVHAVLWLADGTPVDLTPEAYRGQARDITEPVGGTVQIAGHVVFKVGGRFAFRAIVWTVELSGPVITADTLPEGRFAYGLNAAGQVVGSARIKKNDTGAAVWESDRDLIELPCLSKGRAFGCPGRAIAAEGVVVGSSMINWNVPAHAVLWTRK